LLERELKGDLEIGKHNKPNTHEIVISIIPLKCNEIHWKCSHSCKYLTTSWSSRCTQLGPMTSTPTLFLTRLWKKPYFVLLFLALPMGFYLYVDMMIFRRLCVTKQLSLVIKTYYHLTNTLDIFASQNLVIHLLKNLPPKPTCTPHHSNTIHG
jgi:hypothetical protein